MLDQKQLMLIGGLVLVCMVIAAVVLLTRKKEGYYPCSKCSSYGRKVCVNRDNFNDLYREGILTENTIPQNMGANWTDPPGNGFYTYQPGLGHKQCGK